MFATTASLIAALTLTAATKIERPTAPKFDAPKLDLNLPDLPKAEGLSGPEKAKEPELRQAPGDLRTSAGLAGQKGPAARVQAAIHAHDFKLGPDGRKPIGRMDTVQMRQLPARVPPFKTCLRIASSTGSPVMVKAVLQTPNGDELLSSRADVTFNGDVMELVIDWEGFEARQPGDYKVRVSLDGQPAGDFPLSIKSP